MNAVLSNALLNLRTWATEARRPKGLRGKRGRNALHDCGWIRGCEAWLDADDAGHNYFEVCLSCLHQPCQLAKPYLSEIWGRYGVHKECLDRSGISGECISEKVILASD